MADASCEVLYTPQNHLEKETYNADRHFVSEISLGDYDSTETSTSVFRARQKFAGKGGTPCCRLRWKHVLIMLCVVLVSTVLALVVGIAIYVADGKCMICI